MIRFVFDSPLLIEFVTYLNHVSKKENVIESGFKMAG